MAEWCSFFAARYDFTTDPSPRAITVVHKDGKVSVMVEGMDVPRLVPEGTLVSIGLEVSKQAGVALLVRADEKEI